MFHAERNQWVKFKTGVVCFVKDNVKKSYYIRLVDITVSFMQSVNFHTALTYTLTPTPTHSLPPPPHTHTHKHTHTQKYTHTQIYTCTYTHTQTKSIAFEQEIYNQFTYKTDRPYFHSFPGECLCYLRVLCNTPPQVCCGEWTQRGGYSTSQHQRMQRDSPRSTS